MIRSLPLSVLTLLLRGRITNYLQPKVPLSNNAERIIADGFSPSRNPQQIVSRFQQTRRQTKFDHFSLSVGRWFEIGAVPERLAGGRLEQQDPIDWIIGLKLQANSHRSSVRGNRDTPDL